MSETVVARFNPDYASKPGDLIAEYLRALDISARELARRCGRSPKLVSEVINGKAPVEPETALQLERVLDVDASVWLALEANYRLQERREEEERELEGCEDWLRLFPMRVLQERGWIRPARTIAERVEQLLRFFGAGSVSACRDRFDELLEAEFRTSPTFASSTEALATWLRIGEVKAKNLSLSDFDRSAFVEALREIRPLTSCRIEQVIPQIQESCARVGVAFVVEQPFANVTVSGVSRWLSPRNALIQQSLRYRSDDHFWFTFFHECAHLLLHSRKTLFIDVDRGEGNAEPQQEKEANDWATEFLVPRQALDDFIEGFSFDEDEVVGFAGACGVSPGIVVGQLQHRKVVRFNQLNQLKARYDWCPGGHHCVSQRETAS